MELRIRNKLIQEPIINILRQAQKELTNGKLKDIEDKHNGNIWISCPIHKDGFERHASCTVATSYDTDLEPGFAHCFTCGYNAPLSQVLNDLFDESSTFGEDWLVERFGNTLIETEIYLPPIDLNPTKVEKTYLDPSILDQYRYYHPYMWQRKLTKDVVDRFEVGYDASRSAITFPVYDEKHRLVFVTARSVNSKHFWIPPEVEKPVYLLYDILERKQDTVYVAESQINALYLRTFGLNSIGLFGTGSATQYETLRRSGIRHYILCFDGDEAGEKGAKRFRKNMPDDVFITEVRMPAGKDVNDLSFEEFVYCYNNS